MSICDIFNAIVTENVEELKRILEAKAVDLSTQFKGSTALSFAVNRKHYPSVCALVEFGAPLDIRSLDHLHRLETPIIASIRLGDLQSFLKLVHSGAKLDLKDSNSRTALWHAVNEQRVSYVELLLKMRAPITFQAALESPLNLVAEFICYEARRKLAFELVAAGLQVDLKDYRGRDPLFWAIHHSDFNFFCLLIEAGLHFRVCYDSTKIAIPDGWKKDASISRRLEEEANLPPPLVRLCCHLVRNHLRRTHNRDIRPLVKNLTSLPTLLMKILLLEGHRTPFNTNEASKV